jgi:SH3-like domain-containing protein
MKSKRTVFLAVIILAIFLTGAQAELKPAAMDSPEPKIEPNNVEFPYVGEITSSQVNVRSGPGLNLYSCGKISTPQRVIVVAQEYSWSQILPPPGSFSWIFKQYVQTDANNPSIGVVNADNVRVYAGSDEVEPMRSDTVQLLLTRGQKVQIIGDAVGDYYKITPPQGATLWTTSQYIKYIRSADEMDIKIPKVELDAAKAAKPDMIVEQVEAKNRWQVQYYEMEKLFEDEKIKPLEDQNYSKIRAELEILIADPNSGDAGNYAKFLLKAVERCEIAKQSQIELQEHKTELGEKLGEIEKDCKEKQANICDLGKYAAIGIFKPSAVYEKQPEIKRFLIIDSNDAPICYAEPTSADADLTEYYDKQVGLIGKITTDEQSNLALVKFDKIELLEK